MTLGEMRTRSGQDDLDAQPMRHGVDEILQREFNRLADGWNGNPTDRPTNIRSQARLLDLSAATLSRLRNGNAALSVELAERMARVLRAGDAAGADLLAAELLRAANAVTSIEEIPEQGSPLEVGHQLFRWLSRPGAFVATEYRDLPRAGHNGRYSKVAEAAADAIAQGMMLAMVQPFGNAVPGDHEPRPAREVRMYLERLMWSVRGVFREIRDLAHRNHPSLDRESINRRVVLYERHGSFSIETGIQSRLLYVEAHPTADHWTEDVYRAYEWISMDPSDVFVRRSESGSIEPAVLRQQLHPIVAFWRASGMTEIPHTQTLLERAVRDFGTDVSIGIDMRGQCPWTVWSGP